MIARIDAALGRRIDLRSMDILRLLAGPIVILHLWSFVSDARDGRIYRDTFYEPYASWYPELPRSLYLALLCAGVLAGLAMTLRLAPRVSTVVAFAAVSYNLLLSTTHFHNNRAYLVVVLGALALAPVGEGLAWPLWLLRVEAVVVYGGSGLSKLLDADWFGGTVTWGRVVRVEDRLPDWLVPALTDRDVHTVIAKVIVLTELFIAGGLLWPRTRRVAIGVAVAFHVAIAFTADVEVFSLLGIAALVIWLDFERADRPAATGRGSPPTAPASPPSGSSR